MRNFNAVIFCKLQNYRIAFHCNFNIEHARFAKIHLQFLEYCEKYTLTFADILHYNADNLCKVEAKYFVVMWFLCLFKAL